MRTLLALLLTGLAASVMASAGEAQPAFAAKPAAAKAGDKVRIEFAADRETDVAVYVLDAQGKVVRHLAAGVLGAKAPEPLKPGLSQSLEWDGRDDAGKPAVGGPFKARVALGLRPTFDRMIGYNPAEMDTVRSLATGPDGTIYVHVTSFGFGSGSSHGRILAFDRGGKYLRTVAPYPADLPEEKLKGIKRIEIAPGVRVPFVHNAETRALVPGLGGEPGMHRFVVTRDGRLILSGEMGIARTSTYCRLVSLKTDGSIPAEGLLGPGFGRTSPPSLALAPDGKTIYASGVNQGYADKPKLTNALYAFGWSDREPKSLVSAGLDNPQGLAVDKDGNIYVADKGNNRIAVYKPDGLALGELKVDKPERVEVHPKTGAVYVLGGAKVNELQKFASWKDPAAVAKATLPSFQHRFYSAMIALDASAQPPVLWAASCQGQYARFGLLRIEDQGNAFGEQVDVAKLPGNSRPSAVKPTDLTLLGDRLYIWSQRGWAAPRAFDARTGEAVANPPKPPRRFDSAVGFIFEAGRDGNCYLFSGYPTAGLCRFDALLKPFPYPGVEGGEIKDLGSPRTRLRGLCADARGNAYLLRQKEPPAAAKGAEAPYGDANAVAVISPDGKTVNDQLIDSDIRSLNSLRVDPAGNLYLALGARAGGELLPAHLKLQVPDSPKDPDAELESNYYPLMYGSIVKFGPAGGEVRLKGDGLPASFTYDRKVFIKGAQWAFLGASCVPSWVHGGFKPDICMCESPRFEVDGFGRSFFPDACGFRVGVLDTGGNLVCWFGNYGNQDSAGPGSLIPTPEIPIGWVHAVAANDEAAFVGDRLNQRVVRVKLNYAAEAACALP